MFASSDDESHVFSVPLRQMRKQGIPVSPAVVHNVRPGGTYLTFQVEYDSAWTAVVETAGVAQMVGSGTGVGNGTFEVRVLSNMPNPFPRFAYVRVTPDNDPAAYTRVLIEQAAW